MRKSLRSIIASNRIVVLFLGVVLSLVAFSIIASAQVTAVTGSAFGYFSSVSLFGGPPGIRGPNPAVVLPAAGSASPITATVPIGLVQYGPAIFFSSGPITVTTQGTIGPAGSATSTANIMNVNTSGQEVFTASNVASTCTATESGTSGSTTIIGGTLRTSEGNPNVEGDETIVVIPTNPAPNTAYNGTFETVGDRFRYVFNEQIVNPDGSLTVNAAHLYLLGPTAVGDVIIGQSRCGVTAAPTAATVTVSGRVTTQTGRGIRNVVITMTDSNGNTRTATTTSFGYYRFEDVAAGETYIFAAIGKRFSFAQNSQVHSITGDTNNINFVASEQSVLPSN